MGAPKSNAEATGNSAGRKSAQLWGEGLCIYCKDIHKTGDKICGEYIIEAKFQNKMRLYKCYASTAKETLGYKEKQTNNQSSPIGRRVKELRTDKKLKW